MIGQPPKDDNARPVEPVRLDHPILTGFYAAVGGALFAAVFAFVKSQFEPNGEK
jgi:hypothetical protein